MIKRLSSSLLIIFSLLSNFAIAQLSDKEKLTEALYLMDENRYSTALPLLLELHEKDKENANINYNIGLAYLNSFNEKEKENALPFLLQATKEASPNYSPFSPKEKKAPVDAYFYLAKAQHNDYQFIEARDNLLKFKSYINDKHYLWKDVDKNLKMADYAQKAILNPVNIVVHNLGDQLNGYYPDFSPVVRIDETAIYYTSRRLREDSSNYEIFDPQDGMHYEDIYVSFKDEETQTWGKPHMLNINTEGHEATVNLSIDGQTLYIYKDIRGNGELYESKLEADSAGFETWSEPEKLGSDINTKAYETHVSITPDGKRLYFISDRENGHGGKDIYYCNLLPTGQWALSQNAGPILNSEFDEDGVFMHPDGKTLYFSSNGHQSMGGYDIMSSTLTDSGWTSPKNLGYPINSVDDDVFFVTTPDGKRAYFSSFKEEGYGEKDVYMLELLDAEESAITLYRGEFTFIDRYVPPSGALVSITNNNTGELIGYYTPRQRDGQFSAILETNTSYHFTYEADAYETYEEDIYVPASANYQEIYKEIKLRPVRVGDGMDNIPPRELADATVKGALMKDGKPIPNIKILLLEEDKTLIEQTQSDDLGVFAFEELSPDNTYLIEVVSDTGNPILDYQIDIVNDKGEVLTFDKIDENTYIFVPSTQPYKYYGVTTGVAKKADQPLAALNVRLEDEGEELIQKEVTDEYGEFNFQKLDPDSVYRIVFEGDFPDESLIMLKNSEGELFEFNKIDEGVYKYEPVKEADPLVKLEDIKGTITSMGLPVVDLNVLLEDRNRTILNRASTDSVGKFNFMDLNMLEPYYIEFEGDFPPDAELVVMNESLDLMLFRKIGEGLYKYDPSYKVKLVNDENELLEKTETDLVADFNYNKLDPDKAYSIIYEGDFPDEGFIDIKNADGEVLRFERVKEGVYKYEPVKEAEPIAKLEDIEGAITSMGLPVVDLNVLLEDKNRTILNRASTDSVGKFNFMDLNILEQYYIEFEGNFPPDVKLVVSNESLDLMLFRKIGEGLYKYDPSYKVKLVNDENELLEKTETDLVSDFNYNKLDPDREYKIIYEGDFPDETFIDITNADGKILRFKKAEEGIYQYIPGDKTFAVRSYTMDVEDRPDLAETYPRPEELKNVIAYFQRYFIYNAKDINKQNKEFVEFINDIAELVKIRGYADLIITSSASKVPTATWKTNSILTKKRAYDTKALLEQIFKEKGITSDQYNFVDINTLITGPEYKGDFDTNKHEYEKYQYVRIFVK